MSSNQRKMWLFPFLGMIWACSPQTVEPDEAAASQSFSVQIEDIAGNASFHPTRPSIDAYTERAAIRLQDGRVLVAGGQQTLINELTKKAEVFDPKSEIWTEVPPMQNEHVGAKMFLADDGRAVIVGGFLGATNTPEAFDPKSNTWTVGEQLDSPIWMNVVAATLLGNGQVLVASGHSDSLAYFLDLATLSWSPAPPLKYSRIYHSLTVLKDGRVLAAGGVGLNKVSMLSESRLIAEIFDPTNNQWSDAASMNAAHSGHVTTLLDDGRVLLVDLETTVVEIFDPNAGSLGNWSTLDNLGAESRLYASLTKLQDGRVLLAGGYTGPGMEGQARVFLPDKEYWNDAGKLKTARQQHTATLLENGRILIAGGTTLDSTAVGPTLQAAELFVPDEPLAWQTLSQQPQQNGTHTATRLANGRVLLAGFSSNFQDSFLFVPEEKSFVPTAPLLNPHANAASVLLNDGRVIIIGGSTEAVDPSLHALSSVEFFDPQTQQWTAGPKMNQPHFPTLATRLADGRVLVASGYDSLLPWSAPEIFDPVLGSWTVLQDLLPPDIRWANVVALRNDEVLFSGYRNSGMDGFLQVFDLEKGPSESVSIPDFYPSGQIESLLLPDGRVLAQSKSKSGPNAKMGFFDPERGTWQSLGVAPVSGPANFLNGYLFWSISSGLFSRTVIFAPEDEQFTLVATVEKSALNPTQHRTTPLIDGRMLVTGATFMGNASGAYLYGKPNGGACSGTFECASGHCVDGYCCNEACDDDAYCNTCARVRGASEDGMCTKLLFCKEYQCGRIDVTPAGQTPICATSCARASDCATGYACTSEGVCEKPQNTNVDSGCSMDPGQPGFSRSWWLVAACLGLSRLRRKTRPN